MPAGTFWAHGKIQTHTMADQDYTPHVKSLESFGYTKDEALDALRKFDGDLATAAGYLIETYPDRQAAVMSRINVVLQDQTEVSTPLPEPEEDEAAAEAPTQAEVEAERDAMIEQALAAVISDPLADPTRAAALLTAANAQLYTVRNAALVSGHAAHMVQKLIQHLQHVVQAEPMQALADARTSAALVQLCSTVNVRLQGMALLLRAYSLHPEPGLVDGTIVAACVDFLRTLTLRDVLPSLDKECSTGFPGAAGLSKLTASAAKALQSLASAITYLARALQELLLCLRPDASTMAQLIHMAVFVICASPDGNSARDTRAAAGPLATLQVGLIPLCASLVGAYPTARAEFQQAVSTALPTLARGTAGQVKRCCDVQQVWYTPAIAALPAAQQQASTACLPASSPDTPPQVSAVSLALAACVQEVIAADLAAVRRTAQRTAEAVDASSPVTSPPASRGKRKARSSSQRGRAAHSDEPIAEPSAAMPPSGSSSGSTWDAAAAFSFASASATRIISATVGQLLASAARAAAAPRRRKSDVASATSSSTSNKIVQSICEDWVLLLGNSRWPGAAVAAGGIIAAAMSVIQEAAATGAPASAQKSAAVYTQALGKLLPGLCVARAWLASTPLHVPCAAASAQRSPVLLVEDEVVLQPQFAAGWVARASTTRTTDSGWVCSERGCKQRFDGATQAQSGPSWAVPAAWLCIAMPQPSAFPTAAAVNAAAFASAEAGSLGSLSVALQHALDTLAGPHAPSAAVPAATRARAAVQCLMHWFQPLQALLMVYDALGGAVASSSEWTLRSAALQALQQVFALDPHAVRLPKVQQALQAALQADSATVRSAGLAVLCVSVEQAPEQVPAGMMDLLIAKLGDESKSVRKRAMDALRAMVVRIDLGSSVLEQAALLLRILRRVAASSDGSDGVAAGAVAMLRQLFLADALNSSAALQFARACCAKDSTGSSTRVPAWLLHAAQAADDAYTPDRALPPSVAAAAGAAAVWSHRSLLLLCFMTLLAASEPSSVSHAVSGVPATGSLSLLLDALLLDDSAAKASNGSSAAVPPESSSFAVHATGSTLNVSLLSVPVQEGSAARALILGQLLASIHAALSGQHLSDLSPARGIGAAVPEQDCQPTLPGTSAIVQPAQLAAAGMLLITHWAERAPRQLLPHARLLLHQLAIDEEAHLPSMAELPLVHACAALTCSSLERLASARCLRDPVLMQSVEAAMDTLLEAQTGSAAGDRASEAAQELAAAWFMAGPSSLVLQAAASAWGALVSHAPVAASDLRLRYRAADWQVIAQQVRDMLHNSGIARERWADVLAANAKTVRRVCVALMGAGLLARAYDLDAPDRSSGSSSLLSPGRAGRRGASDEEDDEDALSELGGVSVNSCADMSDEEHCAMPAEESAAPAWVSVLPRGEVCARLGKTALEWIAVPVPEIQAAATRALCFVGSRDPRVLAQASARNLLSSCLRLQRGALLQLEVLRGLIGLLRSHVLTTARGQARDAQVRALAAANAELGDAPLAASEQAHQSVMGHRAGGGMFLPGTLRALLPAIQFSLVQYGGSEQDASWRARAAAAELLAAMLDARVVDPGSLITPLSAAAADPHSAVQAWAGKGLAHLVEHHESIALSCVRDACYAAYAGLVLQHQAAGEAGEFEPAVVSQLRAAWAAPKLQAVGYAPGQEPLLAALFEAALTPRKSGSAARVTLLRQLARMVLGTERKRSAAATPRRKPGAGAAGSDAASAEDALADTIRALQSRLQVGFVQWLAKLLAALPPVKGDEPRVLCSAIAKGSEAASSTAISVLEQADEAMQAGTAPEASATDLLAATSRVLCVATAQKLLRWYCAAYDMRNFASSDKCSLQLGAPAFPGLALPGSLAALQACMPDPSTTASLFTSTDEHGEAAVHAAAQVAQLLAQSSAEFGGLTSPTGGGGGGSSSAGPFSPSTNRTPRTPRTAGARTPRSRRTTSNARATATSTPSAGQKRRRQPTRLATPSRINMQSSSSSEDEGSDYSAYSDE